MKILITGKNGQIARCIKDQENMYPELDVVFAARAGAEVYLDLNNTNSIIDAIEKTKPDVVINAAAYTNVDQAEEEPDLAMRINGIAPGILAKESAKYCAKIIQISTDYIFDGELDRPYLPNDKVNPLNVYGKTKLAGEIAVRSASSEHVIFRTAWVYSPYGRNFYLTMLKFAETLSEISVVDDQWGNPTPAHFIASTLLDICDNWRCDIRNNIPDTVHVVGSEEMTWCGFARNIFAEKAKIIDSVCKVSAITSEEYPTRARRPKNSRLAQNNVFCHYNLNKNYLSLYLAQNYSSLRA